MKKWDLQDYKNFCGVLCLCVALLLAGYIIMSLTWQPKPAEVVNQIDPTPLEEAITDIIPAGYDTYDVNIHYYFESISSNYCLFTITGKTEQRATDFWQFD